MLDELLDEKAKLLQKQAEEAESCHGATDPILAIHNDMRQSREHRLKEIDQLVEKLKDMFNECTGGVDAIEPKTRVQKPNESGEPLPSDTSPGECYNSNYFWKTNNLITLLADDEDDDVEEMEIDGLVDQFKAVWAIDWSDWFSSKVDLTSRVVDHLFIIIN